MMLSITKNGKTAGKRWMFRAAVLVALCALPGLAFSADPVAGSPATVKANLGQPPSVKSLQPISTRPNPVPNAASAPAKPAKPVASAPAKPVQPVASAPAKPAKPVASAPAKPVQPVTSAPAKAVQPVTSAPAKPAKPVASAPAKALKSSASDTEGPSVTPIPAQNMTQRTTLADQVSSLKKDLAQAKQVDELASKAKKKKQPVR